MNSLTGLTSAFEFAARKHYKQRRKGGKDIPYINHPIEVVNLLANTIVEPDLVLLTAAALHDTIEDTDATKEEIKQQFGSDVSNLVQEVTDDMSLSKKERRAQQIVHANYLSDRAKQLKIADKTCNVLDILTTRIEWTLTMKVEYIKWAKQVVLACSGVNQLLENEFSKAEKLAREVLGEF